MPHRIIFYSFLGLQTLLLVACTPNPSWKNDFNPNTIDSVRVYHRKSGLSRKLDARQIQELTNGIRRSGYVGPYKAICQYRFDIYPKTWKSPRTITTFGNHFKLRAEYGDATFSMDDSLLFERLWLNQ